MMDDKPVGIAPAGPGWLGVCEIDKNEHVYAPVAAWVLLADGRVLGVEPADGEPATKYFEGIHDFNRYIFCPGCFADGLCMKHGG